MDYKTSLLIYRAQTINENKIWKSKKRLIKSLTPVLRQLSPNDFTALDNYKIEIENLLLTTKNNIATLISSKSSLTDPTQLAQIDKNIVDIKLKYLTDKEGFNSVYKNEKILQIDSFSKYLLLTYCTWSESSFIKLKHTPHGLTLPERFANYGNNIEDKWKGIIEVIIDRIPNIYSGDIAQMKIELNAIANNYVVNNSYLRNKIAHGQWDEALNRDNDDLNFDISNDITFLDVTKLDTIFEIHHIFLEILENIIESNVPEEMIIKKDNSYLFLKSKLDDLIESRKNWTLQTRSKFLKQRSFDTRNLVVANKMKNKNIDKSIIYDITGVQL